MNQQLITWNFHAEADKTIRKLNQMNSESLIDARTSERLSFPQSCKALLNWFSLISLSHIRLFTQLDWSASVETES